MHKKEMFSIAMLVLLSFSQFAYAFSYNLSDPASPSTKPYQGDTVTLTSIVTAANDNICTITCQWQTNRYGPENVGNPEPLSAGQPKQFPFKVLVSGSEGQASDKLTVTCQRYSGCAWGSPDSIPQKTISLSFNYNGDKTCQVDKKEDCYSASNDCICSSDKKCKEDLTRSQDTLGCTTFCGNGLIEKEYESCSTCQKDVGKCDGLSCIAGNECEGKYCVHETCWNKPYKEGDGFCDMSNGENCKTSVADCACGVNQRCGATAMCEAYCGNSVCEASEAGICKADCKWCGDGQCIGNENCNTCQGDCGVCENKDINTEVTKKTQEIVQQSLQDVNKKQKALTIYTVGAIVLIVLLYLLFKFFKHRKSSHHIKKEEKVKKKNAK